MVFTLMKSVVVMVLVLSILGVVLVVNLGFVEMLKLEVEFDLKVVLAVELELAEVVLNGVV